MPTNGDLNIIGKPLPKVDAWAKVTGETKYADDLNLPRMLHGKILRSVYPHAIIRHIDTRQAAALPGVFGVITGQDLPVKFGIMPSSQDEEALAVEKVRHVGDPVAAVAAVDEETAERALDLIEVDYEPLKPIMSIEEAIANPEPQIHTYADRGNIHKIVSLEFGDLEAGFAAADLIREDLFYYEGNTHLPIEQHSAIAQFGADGKLTVWSSTQTPHYVHRALAKTLHMSPAHIRVIATPVGGGFGGKTDPFSHEIVAAKLAMVTGRPVKITLTREEVFYLHRGRHPVLMWIKTGVKRDGQITAMHFRSMLDGGGYGSYGIATTYYTGALQTVTYKVPAYKFEGLRVFTNKPACGPKRGHGTPQPRALLEVHLDKIAEELGLDPAEMRRRYVVENNSKTVNHLTITTCGLRECIDAVVAASGWREKKAENRKQKAERAELTSRQKGIGLACSAYLTGAGLPIYWNDMPHSGTMVKVDRGGGVAVYCGSTDIGQGSDSVLAYIIAEELGIEPQDVRVVSADTDLTPVDLGSYSSRVTLMTGNATIEATRKLRQMILEAAAEKLQVPAESLAMAHRRVWCLDDEYRTLSFAEAAQLAEAKFGTLSSVGSYKPPKRAGRYKGSGVGPTPCYSYSACVAEVECDPETGEVKVDKLWLAHDVGRAINPLLVEGQTEGSAYMGLGEVLMEGQVFRKNMHKGPSLLDYKSPTTLETPEIKTILVETIDPEGPYGAKEAGQGPLLPVIPAVLNAIHDAVGIRIDQVPVTPEMVLKALELKAKGQEPRVGPKRMPEVEWPQPIRVEPPEPLNVER